jgi:hypothetical protein
MKKEQQKPVYEPPKLFEIDNEEEAVGTCTSGLSDALQCLSGGIATKTCVTGISDT